MYTKLFSKFWEVSVNKTLKDNDLHASNPHTKFCFLCLQTPISSLLLLWLQPLLCFLRVESRSSFESEYCSVANQPLNCFGYNMYYEIYMAPFRRVISSHFDHFEWSKWPILKIVNSAVYFHSKWFETVHLISILSIFITNGLKQCNPFPFHFHYIYFHSKCIVNKHPFYLFYPFLPFKMVKTILTKHLFYPFYPFLPFRMVKTISTIPNGNDQNGQKWLFQTGPMSLSLTPLFCTVIILGQTTWVQIQCFIQGQNMSKLTTTLFEKELMITVLLSSTFLQRTNLLIAWPNCFLLSGSCPYGPSSPFSQADDLEEGR